MRKFLLIILSVLVVTGLVLVYKFFGPATDFEGNRKFLYIPTGATKQNLLDSIRINHILKNTVDFQFLANRVQYFEHIKAGKYEVPKRTSVFQLLRKLRNGNETAVKLVINKLRLPEDLANLVGRNFEQDSAKIMAYLDTAGLKVFYRIIPNTYSFPWTYPPQRIFKKLNSEYDKWWDKEGRRQKAKSKGFSPEEIYTVASIVEEETNVAEDKGKIASVYFNRLKAGMPLQADPTIRYALKDFTITRIYYGQLQVASPYNTYQNRGLPAGPICTPSQATLDSVLNAPETDYLYFVAKPNLRGGSTFTSNFADHSRAAKEYQDSLTAYLKRKQAAGDE